MKKKLYLRKVAVIIIKEIIIKSSSYKCQLIK